MVGSTVAFPIVWVSMRSLVVSRRFFEEKYPKEWDTAESLLTMTAALLHDLGHGAYSHTFEHLFDTDHEAITQEIIQSPETEIHQVLLQVAPDFPKKSCQCH